MMSLDRRTFVGGVGAVLAALALKHSAAAQESVLPPKPRYAFVGSRTTKERNARGLGIEVYKIGEQEDDWEQIQVFDGLINPSFLITDPEARFLFTVHGDQSEVTSFAIDASSGKLTKIGSATPRGKNPVHLVPHPASGSMLVANYATGTIARLPLSKDGKLEDADEPLALPGDPGPHKIEQTSSHPHHVVADPQGRFFLVPDKGLDRIFTIGVDGNGKLRVVSSTPTRQGSGPRHIVFSPSGTLAYVINELDSSVTAYEYSSTDGKLKALQIASTLPDAFVGDSRAAEILLSGDGRSLFATNRGHNSVARFVVDASTGRLSDPQWHGTDGGGPRFAALSPSGDTLFVANELTDTIVSFNVARDGTLTRTSQTVRTGSPVSIAFI